MSRKKSPLKIKFNKMQSDVKLPIKGSSHAACFDVYAHSITYNEKDPRKRIVGLGFATEIPKGYRGVIVPRSNLSKHYWILNNSIGIIDSDYRGEWKAVFTNITDNAWLYPFPYEIGERIAQIYFEEILDIEFEETDDLEESDRGTGGFGSTGIK
jgi:dUTP pyrophosphatase